MSAPKKITTPRGEIVTINHKNGSITTKMTWNPSFEKRMNNAFSAAQTAVDSEVLKGCSKYVAFQTGMLQKSGTLGTVIGSGEVRWIAPYAKAVYYRKYTGSNGDPLRGGFWFERWKNANIKTLTAKIKRTFGGGI